MFVGCRRWTCCQGYCAIVGQTERQALAGRGLEVVGPWSAGGLQVKRLMREKQSLGVISRVGGSYAELMRRCRTSSKDGYADMIKAEGLMYILTPFAWGSLTGRISKVCRAPEFRVMVSLSLAAAEESDAEADI